VPALPPRPKLSAHRCPRCEIRKALCFCDLIPEISLQTRVIVLMHSREEVLPTNTARLAVKALVNSELRIHGRQDERMSFEGLREPGRQSLLLYPSEHASELSADFVSQLAGPVNLIVPDANWKQTKKFVRREPGLIGIPHVQLPAGPPSEYLLRTQHRSTNLCTLEAIARAIGFLESRDAQQQLETLLNVLVERTLWSRGWLAAKHCKTAGIPDEAFRGLTPHP
jgi:DTW domain-containing protein